MPWPGDANLHVSIVNWLKGPDESPKLLFAQEGNRGKAKERIEEVSKIGPSLSFNLDVTTAKAIKANQAKGCYQGQTHGHKFFLMKADTAELAISKDKTGKLVKVLRPFLIANQLIGKTNPSPSRYVIDFQGLDLLQAQEFEVAFSQLRKGVLPQREAAEKKESDRNKAALKKNPKSKTNKHHANFLKKWWIMSYPREEMMEAIKPLSRYIVCGRVTKRPIFGLVSTNISPNDALMVFAFDDDYSFGILQSDAHWQWFVNRCSTLTERFRYTSNTVWDSFPWPQAPSLGAAKKVAAAAVALRETRSTLLTKHKMSLRELYRSMDMPGEHPLKQAHANLDAAVKEAYGMTPKQNVLAFLLALNGTVTARELKGEKVQAPGLPKTVLDRKIFITGDALGVRAPHP